MRTPAPKSAARATRRLRQANKKLRVLLVIAFAIIFVLVGLLVWTIRSDLWPVVVALAELSWDARKDVIEIGLKLVGWLIDRR